MKDLTKHRQTITVSGKVYWWWSWYEPALYGWDFGGWVAEDESDAEYDMVSGPPFSKQTELAAQLTWRHEHGYPPQPFKRDGWWAKFCQSDAYWFAIGAMGLILVLLHLFT